jgi:hypothetical protein
MILNRRGQPEARAQVEGPQVKYICIKELQLRPQRHLLPMLSRHSSQKAAKWLKKKEKLRNYRKYINVSMRYEGVRANKYIFLMG